jgi:hypothetical protein
MGIAEAIIAILSQAPTLVAEATTLYTAVKSSLSLTDQAAVDAALAKAIASDANATAQADAALTRAAQN